MKAIHISFAFFASALILFAIHLCSQPYINNNGILSRTSILLLTARSFIPFASRWIRDLLPFLNDRNNKSDL